MTVTKRILRHPKLRVGWVAWDTLATHRPRYATLEPASAMRIVNNARWMERLDAAVHCEMYRRRRRYDVVIFVKAMDITCQEEGARIRERGGRVVFDANVNYYDVWGNYDIPGTKPTEEQQRDAAAMTVAADRVVADSRYLLGVILRFNNRATWIPDNVDFERWGKARTHEPVHRARLVWCGIAKKAKPLLDIRDALASLPKAELVICSNEEPDILPDLRSAIPTTYHQFSMRGYARLLETCDIIISPRRLANGYDCGHTEWKITLGMATGLPAVASPLQSYREAIECYGGGRVVDDVESWHAALEELTQDHVLRADLGLRARRTVAERYAAPVTAQKYLEVVRSLV